MQTQRSPTFKAFYHHFPVTLTCDSGATSSLISESIAIKLQVPINKTSHTASQADGRTTLQAIGEIHIVLTRGADKFILEAVVVKHLDCDILVGMPFLKNNNIVLDIPNDKIIIAGKHHVSYSTAQRNTAMRSIRVNRSQSFLLRSPTKCILLPGDYLEMSTPEGLDDDTEIAIEPRSDNPRSEWPPPLITTPIAGKIRLTNVSSDLIPISRHQHIAQVRYTCEPSTFPHGNTTSLSPATTQTSKPGITHRLSSISIDPDKQLSPSEQNAFTSLHQTYQKVFDGSIGMYNDSFGTVRAYINMGTVEPPPQKARVPIYNRENMDLLQGKMDELINEGVLARPEDLDIEVEYVSPSFLIKKPGGGHRMVTAFNNIGQYTKPIPSKITTSNDVFQFLAQFKYIMKTDMTSQFFQLPMKTESIKYLGVISPYKGVLVYTRAAMGMPG